MSRAIVNVSNGYYVIGQHRLIRAAAKMSPGVPVVRWADRLPAGSPTHQECTYAFKGYAIEKALSMGHDVLLWCDASILPIRSMEPLWRLIESRGYWISNNGYMNDEWTALDRLPLLGVTAEENRRIKHVATTAFGFNVRHKIGADFAAEFIRLAKNGSFHGPWKGARGVQHRHDQTAASVIAHKLGMELTDPPKWFAYKGGETHDTVLMADGAY